LLIIELIPSLILTGFALKQKNFKYLNHFFIIKVVGILMTYKELARKLGYEVIEDVVLLPLGSFRGWEYGLSIGGEKPRVYAKGRGGVKYGELISCYTVHSLIKTLQLDEGEFVIQREDSKPKNKIVGLLHAFKNPELQLDGSIKGDILHGVAKIIPEGHEILERKIFELQEKISEAREISSIPGYENILKNLNDELRELAESYFSLGPEKIKIDEITIECDVECAGTEIRGGKLIINGDVEFAGYCMKNGNLIINGDVKYAGQFMNGGNITVNGNVICAGLLTYGGKLVVEGDVKNAGPELIGGKLIVNGIVEFAGEGMHEGNLIVNGIADYAGRFMKNGNLKVNGNVKHAGIGMEGGSLVVKGDVNDAGYKMKGGILVVKGDVMNAGECMEGGRIAIYGMVGRIYDIHDGGGRIYIDFDKNPDYEMDEKIRPIKEFTGVGPSFKKFIKF
jgi:formylmethanofuran dehydrogenase subunit C